MAVISLFWDTDMAAVTSCENTPERKLSLPQVYYTWLPFPILTDNIYKSSSCGLSIFGLEQTSNIPQACRVADSSNQPRHASTLPDSSWREQQHQAENGMEKSLEDHTQRDYIQLFTTEM